ncbi:hypothetical protein [Pseudoalteromonas peptidolytica]|uniref:Lysozyme n=1 Tax=Pseudoalteromonas peptidolytica F12-50-A1 TaxID=1315280 RepID=A0A8I0MZN8_9GAMM|nr:hypothetical protein [Pseudoalteromonas peptidolytica]MBE0348267.1 hypothetical protein [Pseudoalteromonas peptidolytica F12-50-A1]NLR16553.1 hypothetical protein [Pseudoalteromonas peptidolytica]GEK08922.1 hypothetical protein PPE03_11710 [Pseudoalteromonas peptidolytica]
MLNLIAMIKQQARFAPVPTPCNGKVFIGYECEYDQFDFPEHLRKDFLIEGLTQDEAEELLAINLNETYSRLQAIFPIEALMHAHQMAVIMTAFFYGVGFVGKNKTFYRALLKGDRETAVLCLPPNDHRILDAANMILTGEHSGLSNSIF